MSASPDPSFDAKQNSVTAENYFAEVWNSGNCDMQWRQQCAIKLLTGVNTHNVIEEFFTFLSRHDSDAYEALGGSIYDAVNSKSALTSSLHFDDKYLILIQLIGNVDIQWASDFHTRAEPTYQQYGQSYIRYTRLASAIKNTSNVQKFLPLQGCNMQRISPLADCSFNHDITTLADVKENATTNTSAQSTNNLQATKSKININSALVRQEQAITANDDSAIIENRWISPINTQAVTSFDLYHLPKVRVCQEPTAVAFQHDNQLHYVLSMSDMFHYWRTGGKAGFKNAKQTFNEAYVLPRYGANNYYHSIVDKLPALFGYTLLGLDCPIISTYELDTTEQHFAKMMGIDVDAILVDIAGDYEAKVGVLPHLDGLRPLFFQYLQTLPTMQSPVGPKIYVSRAATQSRRMINEEDIHALVKQHGFDVIAMEDHSLEEQMAIAAHAKTLIGPHGAGLANSVFAAPGSNLFELIPERYLTPLFRQLAIDCGHRYGVLIGAMEDLCNGLEDTFHWRIDIKRMEQLLPSISA